MSARKSETDDFISTIMKRPKLSSPITSTRRLESNLNSFSGLYPKFCKYLQTPRVISSVQIGPRTGISLSKLHPFLFCFIHLFIDKSGIPWQDFSIKINTDGSTYMMGEANGGKGFYKIKYRGPNNVIFEITDNGWLGSKK